MQFAERAAAAGQSEIGRLLRQRGFQFQFLAASGERGFEFDFRGVDELAGDEVGDAEEVSDEARGAVEARVRAGGTQRNGRDVAPHRSPDLPIA